MIKNTVTMTPEMAGSYLENHVNKRPLSEYMVNQILDDMKNGTFSKDSVSVCLNTDGSLYYGQHTLNAIVRLNEPVEINVYQLEGNETENEARIGHLNNGSKYQYESREMRLQRKKEIIEKANSKNKVIRYEKSVLSKNRPIKNKKILKWQ